MLFTGKNTDFTAIWNCSKQQYTVFKSGKYLGTFYRFAEVRNYLN